MSFPWFSLAKYSGVVLSFSGLGAGVCSLIHEKPEEIKHQVELPAEVEQKFEEERKKIPTETIDVVKRKYDLASRKNFVYAKVVACVTREQKRLIAARKHNSERFSWASDRQDERPKYNNCITDNKIPND